MNVRHPVCLGIILVAAVLVWAGSAMASDLVSVKTGTPPTIDGIVDAGEWDQANQIGLPQGYLMSLYDVGTLYLLIDLTVDTTDDPPNVAPPWGDYFWLTVDADIDGVIDTNSDLNYALAPGAHTLVRQLYTAPATFTPDQGTVSTLGAGFGPSLNSTTPHRIWELAISFSELYGVNYEYNIGLKLASDNPPFENDIPDDFFQDFSQLIVVSRGEDCNGNNMSDDDDITLGGDANGNGILDECEPPAPKGCGLFGSAPFMALLGLGFMKTRHRRR